MHQQRTLSSMNSRERSDTFAQILDPNCGLKTCRPSPMKGTSIIRIIPEVAPDGSFRPMFGGKGAAGDVWSALTIENISVNVGMGNKFTVINTPSDKPALDQLNCPFSGAYIKLKHKQKTKTYAKELADKIEALFQGTVKPGQKFASDQPLSQAKDMLIVQAVVLQMNNQTLPKPATKQAVLLSSTSAQSLQSVFTNAHKSGIDLFSPKGGRGIVLKPLAQRGTDVFVYDAEIGDPIPLAEDACRKLWVPWDKAFVRFTYDELMLKLIAAVGQDVAASIYPEDVARLTRGQAHVTTQASLSSATMPVTTSAPVVTAPAVAAPAPKGSEPQVLAIDVDAPGTDLNGGGDDAPAAGIAPSASAQTPEELEKMYAKLLEEDPSLRDEPPASGAAVKV